MKTSASPCVLLGDVVGSRNSRDRQGLHRSLEDVLARVNDEVPATTDLRVTVGDEFQGTYPTLGAAIDAALRVRLALMPEVDTRFGLGRGDVTVLDESRGIEDGPGWWSARSAIETVADLAERAATRHARTAYRASGTEPTGPAVDAALLCRDHLVGSLSDRSLRLLKGLMHPHTTQSTLAEREGISASAVSQRVRTDGIGAVLAAQELLRGIP
ncbi:MAG: SatD family protein [Ornithinibacter sp.]